MISGIIESLTLASGPHGTGAPLEFAVATVNVLVGPNHSGKSLLLREIKPHIDWPYDLKPTKVLKSVQFARWDDEAKRELVDRLRRSSRPISGGAPEETSVDLNGRGISGSTASIEEAVHSILSKRDMTGVFSLGDAVRAGLCLSLNGEERLSILKNISRGSALHSSSDVLGKLTQDDRKLREVQGIVRDAFGYTLVIDLVNEPVTAKFAEVAPPSGFEKSLLPDAVEFFRKCIGIENMSDGVRAFSGMVATVIASDARVIFIDEPEAFLSPELCTKLARQLCRNARERKQQLLIATHSPAFLMGCVQAGIELNIVRLTYRRGSATSCVLPSQELIPLMRQPLLRSTSALSGIFYQSVVVTEADADRAFYDEINQRCLEARFGSGIPDALFLNVQGWQQVARVIAALRRLGVFAAAIVDIDVLCDSESTSMQALLDAAGVPPASRKALGQLRGDLHRSLKLRSRELKTRGLACATGDELRDLQSFVDQLAVYGIFLVPVGELEGWLPNLPRGQYQGKREWLVETFKTMGEDPARATYAKPEDEDIWVWMDNVRSWLHNPKRSGMPV